MIRDQCLISVACPAAWRGAAAGGVAPVCLSCVCFCSRKRLGSPYLPAPRAPAEPPILSHAGPRARTLLTWPTPWRRSAPRRAIYVAQGCGLGVACFFSSVFLLLLLHMSSLPIIAMAASTPPCFLVHIREELGSSRNPRTKRRDVRAAASQTKVITSNMDDGVVIVMSRLVGTT